MIPNVNVRVGQVWRDLYSSHTNELRLVRIEKLEHRVVATRVRGEKRLAMGWIARISSKTGAEPDFRPVTRFINLKRFGRWYHLHKDA